MSLVVKRFKELVCLVDQLLDALTGGIGGLARHQRTDHGERKGRGKTCDANPDQRARQSRVATVLRWGVDLVNFLSLRRVRQGPLPL